MLTASDGSADSETMSRKRLYFCKICFADGFANLRTADGKTWIFVGADDWQTGGSEFGGSSAVAPYVIVETHKKHVDSVVALYSFNEMCGCKREILFPERHYHAFVYARFSDKLFLEALRCEYGGGAFGAECRQRVLRESQSQRSEPTFLSLGCKRAEQMPVSEVYAVEHPCGGDAATGSGCVHVAVQGR